MASNNDRKFLILFTQVHSIKRSFSRPIPKSENRVVKKLLVVLYTQIYLLISHYISINDVGIKHVKKKIQKVAQNLNFYRWKNCVGFGQPDLRFNQYMLSSR
jgi:hypothetical protein